MILNLVEGVRDRLTAAFELRKQPVRKSHGGEEYQVPYCYLFEIPTKQQAQDVPESFPHILITVSGASLIDSEETISLTIGLGAYSEDGYADGCKQILAMAEGVKLALIAGGGRIAQKYSLVDAIETAALPKGEQEPPFYYGGVLVKYTHHLPTLTPVDASRAFGAGYGD